jgi:pimeloyl-ACP methyl ester carboxylesterase
MVREFGEAPGGMDVTSNRLVWLIALTCVALATGAGSASALKVSWMRGFAAPGTPAKYDKVGVIKVGPSTAKNVLVLEPGTSAGSAYFVPLARWTVAKTRGWQVWSVERRQNLLEDQSELNLAKQGKASSQQVYDYYLGFLSNRSVTHHLQLIPDASVEFAKQWGLHVLIEDLHDVIAAAKKLGGKVVLGGHSLGGAVVTAYATWDFHGHAGADDLAGLVFDDGAGIGTPVSAKQATAKLQTLQAPNTSPWLAFGFPAPYLGLYASTGSLSAVFAPNAPSVGQASLLLPASLKPSVPVTNLALFAYNTDVRTSKLGIFAFLAHLGQGIATGVINGVHGWNSSDALTPPKRWATMLSGAGVTGADGVEWYFPERLFVDTLQTGAIDNGNPNAAQRVVGVSSTMGHHLPKGLLMYAFGAYGGQAILAATTALARQSQIPSRDLTLISRHGTYAHNDPAGAYPNNAFFSHLLPFLDRAAAHR